MHFKCVVNILTKVKVGIRRPKKEISRFGLEGVVGLSCNEPRHYQR